MNIIQIGRRFLIIHNPCRILIFRDSGCGKTNALLNLINITPDIDKIYLHTKDPLEPNYQFLIKKT